MRLLGGAGRLLLGATLAWWLSLALLAPQLPTVSALAAIAIFVATLWRPSIGLLLLAGLAPAGALLVPAPARGAELLAWSLLAGWLLRVWHPLAPHRASVRGGDPALAPHRASVRGGDPALSPTPWPRTITVPAALYAGALIASWLTLTIGGAAGVPLPALPQFLFQSIPSDHLILSSPEPETWTALQSLTGVMTLLASVGIARGDVRLARALTRTLVASLAILAAATLFDVARQWAQVGFGGWFLLRYVRGERFSLHLADLNAAGSLYVLGGVAAAAPAILHAGRRGRWLVPFLAIVPALWLTGSRTSYIAAVGGLLILAVVQRTWPLTRRQITVSVAVVCLVLLAGAATMNWQSDVRGSAGRAANLRSQFLETSARMFASSPVFGVGIGRYFDRSPEFMPAALREIYGNENAHNYFAQQFAELGIVGGLLFIWLAVAILSNGWTAVRNTNADPTLVGVFAGTGGYLLTCLTGHPLLVTEAALPFWIAAGVLVGIGGTEFRRSYAHRAVAVAACAVLAAGVGRATVSYARAAAPPPEYGFHGIETAADGTAFRWMTRHAVTYVPNGAGFVRLRLHAPDMPISQPLVIETSIAGRVADRREVPPGRWVTYDIPTRRPVSTPFRRVDFRVNQMWTEEIRLGRRQARRPIAVMAGEIRWIPLNEVRAR